MPLPLEVRARARWWCVNLSVYSIALMPRNAAPSIIVDDDPERPASSAAALVCAARTASAIVSELTIRTTVLTAPQMTFR